jgi:hypothetical protein
VVDFARVGVVGYADRRVDSGLGKAVRGIIC